MAGTQITDVGACVFDAYGTLFDVNSAAPRLKAALGDKVGLLNVLWRQKQLEYTWLRSLMGAHADFDQVTADALDYAFEALAIDAAPVRDDLLGLYRQLAPFPEVQPVLESLVEAGMKTAILSNGTPKTLASVAAHAGLEDHFDAILSVEEAGIFKPAPSVYQLAVDRLGVEASRIVFLSSNGWDAAGAAQFGFQVVWVNRAGNPSERLPKGPVAQVKSLAELPELIGL